MKYLVDANVLSEATKPSPNLSAIAWLRLNERSLTVDPVILGELRFGILLLGRGRRRRKLENWFEEGVGRMECVSWGSQTGLRWAELLAELRARGKAMPIKDSLIAASALANNLVLATRNQRDFEACGVELVDPFE